MLSNCGWAAEKAINVVRLIYRLNPFSISFGKRPHRGGIESNFVITLVHNLFLFFTIILEVINHFCGATDIPVLDFW